MPYFDRKKCEFVVYFPCGLNINVFSLWDILHAVGIRNYSIQARIYMDNRNHRDMMNTNKSLFLYANTIEIFNFLAMCFGEEASVELT